MFAEYKARDIEEMDIGRLYKNCVMFGFKSEDFVYDRVSYPDEGFKVAKFRSIVYT